MFVRKPYKERKSKLSQLRLLNFLIDTAWSLNKIESSSYQTRTKKCNIKHTPDAGGPRESIVTSLSIEESCHCKRSDFRQILLHRQNRSHGLGDTEKLVLNFF